MEPTAGVVITFHPPTPKSTWTSAIQTAADLTSKNVGDFESKFPYQANNTFTGGGPKRWLILLSGQTKNRIENWDPSKASSSSKTSAVQATSAPATTVVVTPTNLPSEEPKKSGPNKAGIAAGVVVGVVVIVAIIGGVLFYLRHRRRRAVEEEYRRQAAVNSFVSGNKLHTSNSSMTDSRLDPEFMMRRQSNGSIADNEDYSRRILKVW
jgi:cell wall integrity and stress response component